MADRRTRPRAGLTRERVVDAALEFVDAHGVAALSMRKLGATLDVEAMTLYHYVPNKDALFEALIDRMSAPLSMLAPDGDEPWTSWLGRLGHRFREQLLAHPGVLPLMATRPVTSRETLERVENTLGVLCDAGLTPPQAFDALNAVMSFVLGHTLAEVGRTPGIEASDMDNMGMHDPAGFPVMAQALAAGPRHEARFGFALGALLAGMTRQGDGGQPVR